MDFYKYRFYDLMRIIYRHFTDNITCRIITLKSTAGDPTLYTRISIFSVYTVALQQIQI